jgi:hypothetical protein
VRSYRASFDEVVHRAVASGVSHPKKLVEDVRKTFDELEAEAVAAETSVDVTDRAEELERLRAYVIPRQEIVIEGRSRIADMIEWAVPNVVMDKLTLEVIPALQDPDERVARGALFALYRTYDYWDWYVERHADSMRLAGRVLLTLMLICLTLGVFMLYYGHIYSGVFCSGAAGALLSVVAKLPPVLGFGANNTYVTRITSRVGVGIAASLIGMGLLASDVISIQLPGDISVAEMLNGRDLANEDEDDVVANVAAFSAPVEPTAIDAGVPQDGGATPSQIAPGDEERAAPAPPQAPKKRHPRHFSPRAVLLIVALAMLFGFSERALSTFEDRVFPSRVIGGPRAPPVSKNGKTAKDKEDEEDEEDDAEDDDEDEVVDTVPEATDKKG